MNDAIAQAYADLPYPMNVFGQVQPHRMAVMATLMGLPSAHPSRCRYLELACGSGGSTLAFAAASPQSIAVGIDITEPAIATARNAADELGLTNATFQCADILQLPASLGEFDYIAAHGFYSWVPPHVRDAILSVCKRHLAPNGVAYVSYNARPGCDLRLMLRDMMQVHTRSAATPAEQVRQARAFIEFLAQSQAGNGMYNQIVEWHHKRMAKLPDALIFHDDLSPVNDPVYFGQFVQHAAAHGLQFLGESELSSMGDTRFEHPLREQMARMNADLITSEQYLDFLCGRAFRETLLCHEEVALDRRITPERIKHMFFSTELEPVSAAPKINSTDAEEFRTTTDRGMTTPDPLAKAIIVELGRAFPASLSLTELHARVAKHLEGVTEDRVAGGLLHIYAAGPMLDLHIMPPVCSATLAERPRLSRLARIQLRSGKTVLTNFHCKGVEAGDPILKKMLSLLDGTRDREALAAALLAAAESGEIPPLPRAAGDERPLRELVLEGLDRNLELTRRFALLEA